MNIVKTSKARTVRNKLSKERRGNASAGRPKKVLKDVLKDIPITIAIDFDGVLHKYSEGYKDGTIYDKPIPRTREILQNMLLSGFNVIIYSARCYDRHINGKFKLNQRKEMRTWLVKHQIPYTCIDETGKPVAHIFIDDRAIRFEGSWDDTMPKLIDEIHKLKGKRL